jgi:hypothetical protein
MMINEVEACSYTTVYKSIIYLRADLNSQWPITESGRTQTAIRQHNTRQNKKNDQGCPLLLNLNVSF